MGNGNANNGNGGGKGSLIQEGLEIAKGVKELIVEGCFTYEVIREPFSEAPHECDERACPYRRIDEEVRLGASSNWPFTGWLASECYVRVVAEVNGCNVANARVRPGNGSWVAWYNSRTYTVVVNSVTVSKVPADSSGCEDCCEKAICIEFDVSVTSSNWAGSDGAGSTIIRVCGDGSITTS